MLPPGHAVRRRRAARTSRDEPWLLDGTELERHVLRRCRQAGFEPRVAGRLFSHEALLYAVRSGLGVTVLPTFALDRAEGVEVRLARAGRAAASWWSCTGRRRSTAARSRSPSTCWWPPPAPSESVAMKPAARCHAISDAGGSGLVK